MSMTTIEETVAAPAAPPAALADPDVTTFRGRTLEELLPQIRDQLGPDAIVVRQRDGLMGGVGGFFQQRFVEVDAKPGHPRIDVYDEEPEPFAALLAAAEADGDADAGGPRIYPSDRQSDSRSSENPAAPALPAAPVEAAAPEPAPLDAQPPTPAPALTRELTATGMSHAFAERLVADAEAHELPFARDLREAVRRALARRIPTSLPHRAGGLAVAFAGRGSTACADALASAYKRAGRDARVLATLDQARARLDRGAPEQVLALDLPPIAAERAEVAALAERVRQLHLDELLLVLPTDLDLPSARALHDRLAPLAPTGIALACEQDDCLGAALELACTTRMPLAYAHDALAGIAPADPATLAERLLP
ncbi:MAG TPA: hypothetical protein VN635_06460 [Conexibacter sp.]|nr:hypothetical protein [Conexibacter sp.]